MKQLQNTLYILTPDTYLFCKNETIAVKVGGVEKVRIPSHTISSIYCFGNVTVSTPLIGFCGERGISLVFLSEYGRFMGASRGRFSGNILLRRRQFGAGGPRAAGPAGAKHIAGKIGQQQAVSNAPAPGASGRECRDTPAIERLTEAARRVQDCPSVDSMRALEELRRQPTFSAMPAMLDGSKFQFSGRNRRPPEDPVNAVLSFLYTLLKNDVQSALEGVGLDPAAGSCMRPAFGDRRSY